MREPGIEAALSLEQVRRVVALAQAGTLDGTARRTGCTPAEVRAAVIAVEATLQVRLFDAGNPPLRPTPAGAALLAEMAGLLARTGPAAAATPAPGPSEPSQQ